MVEPLEETIIIPENFSDFRVNFSSEYRKLARLLNESPNSYKETVVLTSTPNQIYNFGIEWTPSIVKYAFFGEERGDPHQIGVGLYYPGRDGEIMTFAKSPNAQFILSIQDGYFVASIASGEKRFNFRLMNW